MSISVVDPAAMAASVVAATPQQIGPLAGQLPSSRIGAWLANGDPSTVLVVWSGFACDRTGTVRIVAQGPTVDVAPGPIDNCDLVPSYRGLVITFERPIDLGRLKVTLEPTEVRGA